MTAARERYSVFPVLTSISTRMGNINLQPQKCFLKGKISRERLVLKSASQREVNTGTTVTLFFK